MKLSEDGPDATILSYQVEAQIGGKLAQLERVESELNRKGFPYVERPRGQDRR